MRKQLQLILALSLIIINANAQRSIKDTLAIKDSLTIVKAKAKEKWDSTEKAILAKSIYPLIKSSKYSGVIPVDNPDEVPDRKQKYKLLMEVTTGIKDSTAKEINGGFAEVGRLLNLHLAAGIPKENIDIIVVAHGSVLRAFLKDDFYKEKYKVSNPNLPLFKELLDAGVKFIACGQAMFFINEKKEEMLPWVKVSLTAQTVLTNYQLKGYVLNQISGD